MHFLHLKFSIFPVRVDLVHGSSWLHEAFIHLCVKPFFFFLMFILTFHLFFFYPFTTCPATLLLSVPCLLWPFISAAQEKTPKQGQLGRERNADNILRDLKEIFTPSWEVASPSEGNAAQPGQAVCLVLVSLALSWALQNTN